MIDFADMYTDFWDVIQIDKCGWGGWYQTKTTVKSIFIVIESIQNAT